MSMEVFRKFSSEFGRDFFVPNLISYLQHGSYAFGVSDDQSDIDTFALVFPPKEQVYPSNFIHGWSETPDDTFDQLEHAHYKHDGVEYDFRVYSILKFLRLATKQNPDIIDKLFIDKKYYFHNTFYTDLLINNSDLFLTKSLGNTYKGASFGIIRFATNVGSGDNTRVADINEYGYSLKKGYHGIRFLTYGIDLLENGKIDYGKHVPLLKDIRAGKYTLSEFLEMHAHYCKVINAARDASSLPDEVDIGKIDKLVCDMFERYYN